MHRTGTTRVTAGIFICILILTGMVPVTAQTGSDYSILYLNSYHHGMEWGDAVTNGVITGIHEELGNNGHLYIEYCDTKRFISQNHYDQLYQLIREKYQDIPLDLIIVSDDYALSFVSEHYDDLFSGNPVIFCGINYLTPELIAFSPNVTGVIEKKYIKESIDLARSLNPEITEVYIINDRTQTGISNKKAVLDSIPAFGGDLSFQFLEDYTMRELLEIVASLPDQAIVFLNTYARDRDGKYYETNEVIRLVAEHSRVPVYSSSDYYLGDGIVGGVMVPGFDQGRTAARYAALVINGTDIRDIPIKTPEGITKLDYNQLLFYNLPQERIPAESQVINLSSSDIEVPVLAMVFFSALIAVLVFAIIILVYANNQLKSVRKELAIHEERLRMAMEATEDGIYDWDIQKNRMYYSPGYLRMLGFSNKEIAPSFEGFAGYIHPDDYGRVITAIEDYLHRYPGGKGTFEFRMQKKDGEYIWIHSKGEIVAWDGDEPVRMVGTHRDITKSRQHQQAIIEMNKKLNILSSITRHDILNQMTVIYGYFDLIRECASGDAECNLYLDRLQGAFERVERQILFTRDYQNMGVEVPRWHRVENVVREAVSALGKTEISFVTDVRDLFVYADSMLVRVLYNLFENAIRHGEGVVRINTRFEIDAEQQCCLLIIEDDGIGIPDPMKEKIFEKGVGSNSGLGLFLVRNILAITEIGIIENGTYTSGARFEMRIPKGYYRFGSKEQENSP
ncbi:MAG: PAS domain-containing protein [Methanospirillaceae archaeon]|nr:PAS domain-containing protein [Methanospirillaceae archaeon]